MSKQRAEWWRYSNIIPVIFTALTTLVVVTAFIATISNKLDNLSQKIDIINQNYQQLVTNDQKQQLQIQHLQDTADGSAIVKVQ